MKPILDIWTIVIPLAWVCNAVRGTGSRHVVMQASVMMLHLEVRIAHADWLIRGQYLGLQVMVLNQLPKLHPHHVQFHCRSDVELLDVWFLDLWLC